MSSNPGIQNYSEMEDKDKAYLVKLLAVMVASIITGILTGLIYTPGTSIAGIGFLVFFVVLLVMSFVIKTKFDLSDMNNVQIIRHGIMVCFLIFLFFWTTIFQFVAPDL